MSQVRIDLGIADHVWQEKRATIAATIDLLGDKFKPELRAGWLANIRETGCCIWHRDALVLDGWVPDAIGLYAHWSPVVDVLFGKFSTMNTHPNAVSDFWNNKYNTK